MIRERLSVDYEAIENYGALFALRPDRMTRGDHVESAMDARVFAHDLVEHVNGVCEIGSIDDELEALGALWLIRGGSGANEVTDEGLRHDVEHLWSFFKEGVDFRTPIPQVVMTEDVDEILIEEMVLYLESEWDDSEDGYERERLKEYIEGVRAFMAEGMQKTRMRYSSPRAAELCFQNTYAAFEKMRNYFDHYQNFEFVIEIDPETGSVNWEDPHKDEYEENLDD